MINFLDELEDFLGIEGYSCKNSKFFPFFEAARFIIIIIQIAVPFALVIWGSLDWFKALMANDEKEMRVKRKPFITRVIAAIIILILPWIISLISEVVAGQSDTVNFWTCYNEASPRIDFTSLQDDEDESTPPASPIEGFTGDVKSVDTQGEGGTAPSGSGGSSSAVDKTNSGIKGNPKSNNTSSSDFMNRVEDTLNNNSKEESTNDGGARQFSSDSSDSEYCHSLSLSACDQEKCRKYNGECVSLAEYLKGQINGNN